MTENFLYSNAEFLNRFKTVDELSYIYMDLEVITLKSTVFNFPFFSIHFPYLHISYNDDVLFLHLEKNLIKINNTLYLSNISSHFTLQEITKLTLSLHIFLSCISYLSNIIWTSSTAEIWQISPYSLCLPCPILLSLIYFFSSPKKEKKVFCSVFLLKKFVFFVTGLFLKLLSCFADL